MKSPCYKCADREIGCHGRCEKYIAFTEWAEQQREARKQGVEITGFQIDAEERKKVIWSRKTGKWVRGNRKR